MNIHPESKQLAFLKKCHIKNMKINIQIYEMKYPYLVEFYILYKNSGLF